MNWKWKKLKEKIKNREIELQNYLYTVTGEEMRQRIASAIYEIALLNRKIKEIEDEEYNILFH